MGISHSLVDLWHVSGWLYWAEQSNPLHLLPPAHWSEQNFTIFSEQIHHWGCILCTLPSTHFISFNPLSMFSFPWNHKFDQLWLMESFVMMKVNMISKWCLGGNNNLSGHQRLMDSQLIAVHHSPPLPPTNSPPEKEMFTNGGQHCYAIDRKFFGFLHLFWRLSDQEVEMDICTQKIHRLDGLLPLSLPLTP